MDQDQENYQDRFCYTGREQPLTTEHPGVPCPLPPYILAEFRELFPSLKKRQIFFGGHPVSITRQSCQQIFTLNQHKTSPYLACEKSDGVRYLLLVARVLKRDILRPYFNQQPQITQCYFISRGGRNSLESFVADVGVAYDIDFASAQQTERLQNRYVVEILDGELVKQRSKGREYYKYLIFDALVHLGRNICQMPLRDRLQCINKFLKCNSMLGPPPCRIPIQLKDFFRLTNRKFNVMDFLLNKYVKMIEHENDGIIFNHEEKEYVLGTTNPGYVKWKPEHLNTIDFMIVPNANLEDRYGKRVLDLYVAIQDADLNRYTRQFYAFTVVNELDFDHINELIEKKEEERFLAQEENHGQSTVIDEFTGSIIAQCRFDATKSTEEKDILRGLSKEPIEELRSYLMKQGEEERDFATLAEFSKKIYLRNWHIYKIREDKPLPNNIDVVKRIEESIRDGIKEDDLLRRGKEINENAFLRN